MVNPESMNDFSDWRSFVAACRAGGISLETVVSYTIEQYDGFYLETRIEIIYDVYDVIVDPGPIDYWDEWSFGPSEEIDSEI